MEMFPTRTQNNSNQLYPEQVSVHLVMRSPQVLASFVEHHCPFHLPYDNYNDLGSCALATSMDDTNSSNYMLFQLRLS